MRDLRRALTLLLLTAVLLSIMAGTAAADPVQAFEQNANADVAFFTYDNLTDMATGHSAATDRLETVGVWSNAWSMVGLAHDGTQYIQVFEKDANADLAFFTYATLADVAAGFTAATDRLESVGVWSNAWSMVGLAHDGTQYIQAFEKDANADLAFFTYTTLADVATGHSARTGRLESVGVWSNAWSMVGLGHDGSQYVQAFEKDANADLAFFTYADLTDLATGHSAATDRLESVGVWSDRWSMVGLALVPEPCSLTLLGIGGLGLLLVRRRRKPA